MPFMHFLSSYLHLIASTGQWKDSESIQAKPLDTIYNVHVNNTTTNTLVCRTLFAAPPRRRQEERPPPIEQQQQQQQPPQVSTCVQPTKSPPAFQSVALPSGEALDNLLAFLKTSHLHNTAEEVRKCKKKTFCFPNADITPHLSTIS